MKRTVLESLRETGRMFALREEARMGGRTSICGISHQTCTHRSTHSELVVDSRKDPSRFSNQSIQCNMFDSLFLCLYTHTFFTFLINNITIVAYSPPSSISPTKQSKPQKSEAKKIWETPSMTDLSQCRIVHPIYAVAQAKKGRFSTHKIVKRRGFFRPWQASKQAGKEERGRNGQVVTNLSNASHR